MVEIGWNDILSEDPPKGILEMDLEDEETLAAAQKEWLEERSDQRANMSRRRVPRRQDLLLSAHGLQLPLQLVFMLPPLLLLLFLTRFCACDDAVQPGGGGGTLTANEVDALRDIAKELGKHDWNFTVDPCSKHPSWYTLRNTAVPTYVNQLNCKCFGVICHVYNISLKGQDLSGSLPKSLVKLPHLEVIDLTRNYLTGTIPREWASMNLTYLSVIVNQLSGPIPKYLGNFTTLIYLSLESNLFSGAVPAELGKLTNLQNLTLSVNFLTGELPKELMNLANLTELRISSNNFSGRMPDYFRSWQNLKRLEIQGSGFQGPIPDSISVLNNLVELRISDLNGEGSKFPSLTNMNNLKNLMLRNCNISGSVPKYLADLSQLNSVDLSFNRLEGPIPDELQALSLDNMYLTSNFLNGRIPDWIKTMGRTDIDLSYNNFDEKSVPSSCINDNLNLYRSSSRASNSTLAVCLTKYFPCTKVRYSLYINCGGKEINIGGTTYDKDDEEGGAAKFFPRREEWGFSSSGHFWSLKPAGDYIARNTSVLRMNDSGLYTEGRLSAMSLTYYGRCLASGNYTVTLHFSEIIFKDDNSFYSLGRRIFDIYIQDFDIKKEAKGADKVLIKTFKNIPVKDTVEIRFYYAGEGSTAVPVRGTYGPLISALSVESEFSPPPDRKRIVKIVVATVTSSLGLLFYCFWYYLVDTSPGRHINGTRS
ncbi:hypothetical protein Ancab_034034 [Ancistrocladus abbreviatus]